MGDIEKIERPRLIDIVILYCPYCRVSKRVAAVSQAEYEVIVEHGIKIACEPCRREAEQTEYERRLRKGR